MAPSYKDLKKNQKKKAQNLNKKNNKHGRPPKRTRTKEIVFDPEARRDYLRGFSERKRQRRAYGLAMQKVKDRKTKLEARKDLRKANLEQIEEAERLKEHVRKEALITAEDFERKKKGDDEKEEDENEDKNNNSPEDNDGDDDNDVQEEEEEEAEEEEELAKGKRTTTYHDKVTQQQWGGDVVVSISTSLFDSDDDEEAQKPKHKKRAKMQKSRDAEQEYAGNVEKFLTQFKQKMPATKKQQHKHGGNHGASAMKGIGNAKEMKMAQQALARSKGKGGGETTGKGSGKGRGKKGKKWCILQ